MTYIKSMSGHVQRWLDRFLNRMPSSQHEPLVDKSGIVYWLETVTDAEGKPSYLRLFYRGKSIGCEGCCNVVNLTWDLPDRLYLSDICLPPERRGVGIGSQLLHRVIALAKQQGVSFIQGNIVEEDAERTPGLLDWYRDHGFRVESPIEKGSIHGIIMDII